MLIRFMMKLVCISSVDWAAMEGLIVSMFTYLAGPLG